MSHPDNPSFEHLEPRRLLSATLSLKAGTLWVLGDDGGNTITVGYSSADASRIRVSVNGTGVAVLKSRNVDFVALEGGAGDDTLQVDQSLQAFAKNTIMVGWA